MTRPTDYHIITRDFGGSSGWDVLAMTDDQTAAMDEIIASFDDGITASLDTVQVWQFTADAPPRDVTEDVLQMAGKYLAWFHSEDPDRFPQAFIDWAGDDIHAAIRDADDGDDSGWDDVREGRAA